MLGLPSASLRSFVLDSDPIPRAMLSIDPTFSFFTQWPAVKGILQMRQWFMGQTAAPVVNPARFLYNNVGEVYLIKWTVSQGHKVFTHCPAIQMFAACLLYKPLCSGCSMNLAGANHSVS